MRTFLRRRDRPEESARSTSAVRCGHKLRILPCTVLPWHAGRTWSVAGGLSGAFIEKENPVPDVAPALDSVLGDPAVKRSIDPLAAMSTESAWLIACERPAITTEQRPYSLAHEARWNMKLSAVRVPLVTRLTAWRMLTR